MVETEGRSSQEGPLRASRWASGAREAQGLGARAKYASYSHGGRGGCMCAERETEGAGDSVTLHSAAQAVGRRAETLRCRKGPQRVPDFLVFAESPGSIVGQRFVIQPGRQAHRASGLAKCARCARARGHGGLEFAAKIRIQQLRKLEGVQSPDSQANPCKCLVPSGVIFAVRL